ncbi:MAG: EAL domain-containing protein, partial [Ardenticatenales bacterium]|nr:EAL domain-containing protein [Ardenticatenales bacterium]
MNSGPIRLLLVEDDEDDYIITRDLLREIGTGQFAMDWVTSYEAGMEAVGHNAHDLCLFDYRLGSATGLDLLREVRERGYRTPIILLTGQGDHEVDVEAIRAGASDYLVKGQITATLLERSIRHTLERAQTLEALRESEERYVLAVRGANDGLWDWNLKSNEVYYSPRWKTMLGCQDDEVGSSPDEWFKRVHPEDIERVRKEIGAHLDGLTPHFEHEYRMLYKDGSYRWVLTRGLAVRDQMGKVTRLAGSLTDITDRKHFEEQLLHNALHDPMTGLPNRALFLSRLTDAVKRSKRRKDFLFAVFLLDLDRFKELNEKMGPPFGDQLLMAVAHRLELCLRGGDTVARLGGDQFAILLDDIKDVSNMTRIVERIQAELLVPFYLVGEEIEITSSIGIALSATGYDNADDVMRDADMAMYRAKTMGKARYEVFDVVMHTRAMARLEMEAALRQAIERQEFQLFYQPIVSLASGKITGFEALIRWQHPKRGLVSPNEFIPVAEESGLIIPMGRWILKEACAQVRAWQLQFPTHPPLNASVNLAGPQFAQLDLVEQISQVLRSTGLDGRSLKIEITESIIMRNAESSISLLSQLRTLNVQLYIDDFGTGYSSLSYLHDFPTDALKIDQSFIRRMSVDQGSVE